MTDLSVPMGCTNIRLQRPRASKYLSIPPRKSDKGWWQSWFYLRNNDIVPMSVFSGRLIEEAPNKWRYKLIVEEQQRLGDLLRAIETLKGTDFHEVGVIGAYHIRRLAPLMARKLHM
jgi:hypothetical protein